MTIESSAFVEIAVAARNQVSDDQGAVRVSALVSDTLARAQRAGLAPAWLTASDVLITQRMVYGVVIAADHFDSPSAAVDRALALVEWVRLR